MLLESIVYFVLKMSQKTFSHPAQYCPTTRGLYKRYPTPPCNTVSPTCLISNKRIPVIAGRCLSFYGANTYAHIVKPGNHLPQTNDNSCASVAIYRVTCAVSGQVLGTSQALFGHFLHRLFDFLLSWRQIIIFLYLLSM